MNKICKNKVAPIRKTLEYYSYVLPVLTAVINFLGTSALAKLGQYERHFDLEAFYVSDASKMAFFEIVNTAILPIYYDMYQAFTKPELRGRLNIFSPEWFKTIGAGICFTMITMILVEFVRKYAEEAINGLSKLYDRGCCCRKDKFTK